MLRVLISFCALLGVISTECPILNTLEDAVIHSESNPVCGKWGEKEGCVCDRWPKARDSNGCPTSFYVKCYKGGAGITGGSFNPTKPSSPCSPVKPPTTDNVPRTVRSVGNRRTESSSSGSCVKINSYENFQETLSKYDVVLVGESRCGSTQEAISEINADNAISARCAYIMYDDFEQDDQFWNWYTPMFEDIERKGNKKLPFAFFCEQYVGGKFDVMERSNKIC